MKQSKLLILLLVISILIFKQYNTEMDTVTSDAGIELLEITKKDELLDANSSLKKSNDLEELFVSSICDNIPMEDISDSENINTYSDLDLPRDDLEELHIYTYGHRFYEDNVKERNELFIHSIRDIEKDSEVNSKVSSHKYSDAHIYSPEYLKVRFIYTICDTTINILNEFDNEIEKVSEEGSEEERMLSREESSDEQMYPIEIMSEKSERLETLIRKIADHPELSAAEKELTISSIRYGDVCPLECLDGYSKYKEEFFILHPTGYDAVNNLTFEDATTYYASFGKRIRDNLEQDI